MSIEIRRTFPCTTKATREYNRLLILSRHECFLSIKKGRGIREIKRYLNIMKSFVADSHVRKREVSIVQTLIFQATVNSWENTKRLGHIKTNSETNVTVHLGEGRIELFTLRANQITYLAFQFGFLLYQQLNLFLLLQGFC